jgi:hypothetical protein
MNARTRGVYKGAKGEKGYQARSNEGRNLIQNVVRSFAHREVNPLVRVFLPDPNAAGTRRTNVDDSRGEACSVEGEVNLRAGDELSETACEGVPDFDDGGGEEDCWEGEGPSASARREERERDLQTKGAQ